METLIDSGTVAVRDKRERERVSARERKTEKLVELGSAIFYPLLPPPLLHHPRRDMCSLSVA